MTLSPHVSPFPPEFATILDNPLETIQNLQRALATVQTLYLNMKADRDAWKTRALDAENTAMIARGYASSIMDATRECARR